MKSLRKMSELANRFEYKIKKQADEVGDSTLLTLSIRPIVNKLLEKYNPLLAAAVKKIMTANMAPGGDAIIGDKFFTDAKLQNKMWVVAPSSTVAVSGELSLNPAIQSLVKSFNAEAARAITVELNRQSTNLEGDTITKHESNVSNISAGF